MSFPIFPTQSRNTGKLRNIRRDDRETSEQGKEVFAASPAQQKRFLAVPGVSHNDLPFTKPPTAEEIAAFLDRLDRR